MLESVTEEAHQLLANNSNLLVAESPYKGIEIAKKYSIHGIITRGKGDVSEALISACPDLEVIARCGVGLDNVNVKFASQQGVKVVNAPGSNADTVAEHTLGLMLALQRNLYNSFHAVKAGNWGFRNTYKGDEIRGKTLGILGMGNIGQKVAKLATAFGMEVAYCGRTPKEVPYKYMDLAELLTTADIFTLHLPLNAETKGLINQDFLNKMKTTALIINTSRGAIIEEVALIDALENQKIGGYATDVLSVEPPPSDHPLLKLSNVLITPHSASLTASTYNYMCVSTVNNALKILKGDRVEEQFVFNRKAL